MMPIYVTDFYTEARYYVERLAQLYFQLYGVSSIGLRLFSVYGPKETFKGKYANTLTQFLWNMKAGRQPIIYGDGKQRRDLVYVSDVVRAFLLASENKMKIGVFNVGTLS